MKRYLRIVCAVTLFGLSTPALADAGVPMLFLSFPFALLALIPITLIETKSISNQLQCKFKEFFGPVLFCNVISTVFGYPFAWAILLGVEFATTKGAALGLTSWVDKIVSVTLQAAWLTPYEDDLHWMIPAAGLVNLIPTFFVSNWIEFDFLKRFISAEFKITKRMVWRANLLSYSLLAAILLVRLGYAVLVGPQGTN